MIQQTVAVTNAVARAGSNLKGLLLINLSTTATIWLKNTTDVADSNGIPLYPGTSLTWIWDGDVWVIKGSDSQSVKTTNVLLVVTDSISDWQPNPIALAIAILNSGSVLVDNPVIIVPNGSYTATTLAAAATDLAVSTFQSLCIQFAIPGTTTYPCAIKVIHKNAAGGSGATIWNDVISFGANPTGSAVGAQQTVRLPLKGPVVTIAFQSGAGADSITINVQASNRVADSNGEFGNAVTGGGTGVVESGIILAQTAFAVPGGAAFSAQQWSDIAYRGEVDVFTEITGGAAADLWEIREATGITLFRGAFPAALAGGVFAVQRLSIPSSQIAVRLQKIAAGAATGNVYVIPVPGAARA